MGNVPQLLPVTSTAVHLYLFIWWCWVLVVGYGIVSLH